MDKILFRSGELRSFIVSVQEKMGLDANGIALLLAVSARTIRDWRREKFNPSKDAILKLSKLSGLELPIYKILPQYWYVYKGAKLGGKRRYELYGVVGTIQDRSKGGKASWNKRKNNPTLLVKYTKTILEPEDSVDLAEFIGIMLGDGGLTHFQCSVYLNSETDKEFAYYVRDLVLKLFGVTPKIYVHKKHKVWRVSISSVNLVKYLTSKGLSIGDKVRLQAGVPSWIWLKPEYIKACIRGLIDTDGSFIIHQYKIKGKEYSYPRLTFSNRSKPLLDFVYKGLKKLGFNPRIQRDEVCLYNQNEVKRYLEVIGVNNYRPCIRKLGWVARVV